MLILVYNIVKKYLKTDFTYLIRQIITKRSTPLPTQRIH